jgi:hypothetical protein
MLILQAQFNNFVHPPHESVESLGLGMASPQSRHGPNIVALLVSLDDNSELARRLHKRILAWAKTQAKRGDSRPRLSSRAKLDNHLSPTIFVMQSGAGRTEGPPCAVEAPL